jgi:superfamily II DNA or RNA helicase
MINIKGYILNKKKLSTDVLTKITDELTVKPVNSYNTDSESYKLYTETDTEIIIPRYYGIEKFGKVKEDFNCKNINIKFNGNLREPQNNIVDTCVSSIKNNGGCMLILPCGEGKTVIAIKIATMLKVKTLVITHKSQLMDQWQDRIKQFTNATVGKIRQSTLDVNNDIVLAMIQTLSKKTFDEKLFGEFGLVIYDECHHFSSKHFSKSLNKTSVKYTLGLTATPDRQDGLTKVLYWYIGAIAFQKKLKINNNVIVKMFHYYSTDTKFCEKKRYFKGEQKPDNTKMISNLIAMDERNEHIVEILNELRKHPRRNTLVLSDRVNHLRELKRMLDIKIGKDECKTYEYTGKVKREIQIEAEQEGDVLFGTFKLAEEGLDISRLNTIVLTTSKKNVIQAIGRILRNVLATGDVAPLIIDMYDKISIYRFHGIQRKRTYITSKYNVEHYFLYNNTIVSSDEFNALVCDTQTYKSPNKTYSSILQTDDINID